MVRAPGIYLGAVGGPGFKSRYGRTLFSKSGVCRSHLVLDFFYLLVIVRTPMCFAVQAVQKIKTGLKTRIKTGFKTDLKTLL